MASTTGPTDGQVNVDRLRQGLHLVLRSGIRPSKLLGNSDLLAALGLGTTLGDAFQAESILLEATRNLGEGPWGAAARTLMGATGQTLGLPLKRRHALAADELDILPTTFRRLYEPDLLEDILTEVLRQLIRTEHGRP